MSSVLARDRVLGDTLRSTVGALTAAFGRWDARLVFLGALVVYFVVYAFATGALSLTGNGGLSVLVVERPLQRMFRSMGYLSFEPVARVDVFALAYLFSPVDAALAVLLATLVGANLALSYLGLVQPRSCGLHSSTGVLAALPALFSGAACCGPVLLFVLGIQATGVVITGFQLLVPLALVVLVASLLLIGRKVDPELL